jgi:hypothetical protein
MGFNESIRKGKCGPDLESLRTPDSNKENISCRSAGLDAVTRGKFCIVTIEMKEGLRRKSFSNMHRFG